MHMQLFFENQKRDRRPDHPALGPGQEGEHVMPSATADREEGQRERGADWHLQKSDFAMLPRCSVTSVGAGAAAGDTVGAPDLSYTPGLDSGCTASQGA